LRSMRLPSVPTSKISKTFDGRPRVVLVACGSFNPITLLHLRLFEEAKNFLDLVDGSFQVILGLLSPTHDEYARAKPNIVFASAEDRLAMARAAVTSSNWIDVASWECEQKHWTTTYATLTAYCNYINQHLGATPDNEVRIKLLCGSDTLHAMLNDKIWPRERLLRLLNEFGVVCLQRPPIDCHQLVFDTDFFFQHRQNIHVVPQWIHNNISSTVVRLSLQRQLSVRYLVPDEVVEHIHRRALYQSKL